MQELKHPRVVELKWRSALAVVAICVLTLSFATRFASPSASFRAPLSSHSRAERSVDRRSLEPERQHLDRDGAEWASPGATVSLVHLTALEATPVSAAALLPTLLFAGCLYVRPPPSAQFLF